MDVPLPTLWRGKDRMDTVISSGSFIRKGEVFVYVQSIQTLLDGRPRNESCRGFEFETTIRRARNDKRSEIEAVWIFQVPLPRDVLAGA